MNSLRGMNTLSEISIDDTMFRKACHNAGHAVLITDRDGQIEYVNPAFEETTGYSFSEVVGKSPRILKSDKHSDEFYANMWQTILAGEAWQAEIINKRKTGELYRVDQTITPLTDDTGTITHFIAIEYDITERKLREQRLMVLNRVIRHNLRNAINVIDGNAEQLIEDLAGTELQSTAETIQKQVRDLDSIVSDTVAVESFFKQPPDTLESSGVDVVTLLNDLKADIDGVYPAATISFYVDFSTCEIHADERLKRAIWEAIDNAVRHTDRSEPDVDITATMQPDRSHVEIEIADNGPGIPAQEQAAIDNETETPLVHGAGIGLWLIYWIVSSFGGEVTFGENDRQGSTMTLRLPTVE